MWSAAFFARLRRGLTLTNDPDKRSLALSGLRSTPQRYAVLAFLMEQPRGALNQLFPLPPEILDGRVKDGLTYPVVVYDHGEGRAVSDGFAYHGGIAALHWTSTDPVAGYKPTYRE